MTTVTGQAVLNPPVLGKRTIWDLLTSNLDCQESEEEQSSSPQPDQPTTPVQDTESSAEDLFESWGYRIGRLLGAAARGLKEVRLANPNSLNQEAIPEALAWSQLALEMSTVRNNNSTYSNKDAQPALNMGVNDHTRSPVSLRPLAYGERFGANLRRNYDNVTLKFPLKDIAKFCLDQLIRSHTVKVALGGVGILELVLKGGLPSIGEIGEQVIEVFGSIGEYVLGLLIGPHLAQIAAALAVVLAILLYRRYWHPRMKT
jgi:hypothetical protein